MSRSGESGSLGVFDLVDELRRTLEGYSVQIAELDDEMSVDAFGELWMEASDPDVVLT